MITDHPQLIGQRICDATRLLYFPDEAASKAWNERHCSALGGTMPVLARWRCRICGGVHHWSTVPSDTNGGHAAGSMAVPGWVREACDKSPEVFVLVRYDENETGSALRQAQRNQDRYSALREQITSGTHPRQTKAAKEFAGEARQSRFAREPEKAGEEGGLW